MYILTDSIQFPPVTLADANGLLAIGGDLSVDRLLKAYHNGIFPWYDEDQPILWYSPDPRMVLFPPELRVSKSMRQLIRKNKFEVTFNKAFDSVVQHCATIKRPEQEGTWITNDMQKAYTKLHQLGYAISVEVWEQSVLVGGLYGVLLEDKKVFCGESMFSKVSNASKYGFITLVEWLIKKEIQLIDCQVYTDHLASLGAREITRTTFIKYLK
ncbi:leucyl/phenylalanyl-tRNA--protein transferase [Aquimarina sp. EL_43]|uniref:leucyl/phenylalanyl-tRNA--protein transferase n=1 Tax=unclassified Aquimarina TaxID=2627091 RepID=UPI0018CBCB92|nr:MULTISPECIES: leucyl/phenylalanyl-tRNA--protein transferase [unclassified Aquimarina]MBG6131936.1 leucyl/phenylalanyl-tRNA--protein transferase [Aquimarina sp. EL_35]MBG6149500.1 leucyl/phenylalanyl-tRNA--protein transferase [Aquimarina sp. EL_32]MBG6170237.1 leucyl/phenylalanyl-tRNA--protein transferase [Aquimarina sp. EL_43]